MRLGRRFESGPGSHPYTSIDVQRADRASCLLGVHFVHIRPPTSARKLDASDRTHAVTIALKRGILDL
jgi:hypothetical protein